MLSPDTQQRLSSLGEKLANLRGYL